LPNFFIPHASGAEEIGQLWSIMSRQRGRDLVNPEARLFQIVFQDKIGGPFVTAEVGRDLIGWRRERVGPVLAIIETTSLMLVHTQARSALKAAGPIHVSTDEVRARQYFDDYPVRPANNATDTKAEKEQP
jgi:hypothetical protein